MNLSRISIYISLFCIPLYLVANPSQTHNNPHFLKKVKPTISYKIKKTAPQKTQVKKIHLTTHHHTKKHPHPLPKNHSQFKTRHPVKLAAAKPLAKKYSRAHKTNHHPFKTHHPIKLADAKPLAKKYPHPPKINHHQLKTHRLVKLANAKPFAKKYPHPPKTHHPVKLAHAKNMEKKAARKYPHSNKANSHSFKPHQPVTLVNQNQIKTHPHQLKPRTTLHQTKKLNPPHKVSIFNPASWFHPSMFNPKRKPTLKKISHPTKPKTQTRRIHPSPGIIDFGIGPAWAQIKESQTILLNPDLAKTYVPTNQPGTLGMGTLFMGWKTPSIPHFLSYLGVDLALLTRVTVQGEIWDDADPEFINSTYEYKIHAYRAGLQWMLSRDIGHELYPYISASAGASLNHASAFIAIPLSCSTVVDPVFKSQTKASFSYSLGAGIQKTIDPHFKIGLGYNFTDWAQSQLSPTSEQTLKSNIHTDHLYTNTALFKLSYITE